MEFSFQMGFLLAGLSVAGLASGLIAGLLGVGGGIILVPVLFQTFILFDVDASIQIHCAVATSLAVICLTSLQSWRSHSRRGAVDLALLLSWAPLVVLGAVMGTIVARYMSAAWLIIIFAGLSGVLGVRMLVVRGDVEVASKPLNKGLQMLGSWAIGFFSALMGIGGGTFSVPLIRRLGRDIRQAVATAAGLGFFIAAPATLGFILGGWGLSHLPPYSLGFVNVAGFLAMFPAALLGAPLGAALAHRLDRRVLQYIFAGFLLATALRMGYAFIVSSVWS